MWIQLIMTNIHIEPLKVKFSYLGKNTPAKYFQST